MKTAEQNAAHQRSWRRRHPLLRQARQAAERNALRELARRHPVEYRALHTLALDQAKRDRGLL